MMNYKQIIAAAIQKVLPEESCAVLEKMLAVPPSPEMGDVAFPCFPFAKKLRKGPPVIAGEIMEALQAEALLANVVQRMEVSGGYLNFHLNRKAVAYTVISEILKKGSDYGKTEEGSGKTVLVEFSSPNIAKPFHIGHLVSTAVGSSIERIYRQLGYHTVKINHLGDWGTQFGKLICAYKHWGDEMVIRENPIHELMKIYVRFHKEAESDPQLEEEARSYFKQLEDGEPAVTALWKFFVEESLKEFNRMYQLLGITFDSYAGESFYSDKMPEIVDILREKNLLEESDGAQVIRFAEEQNMPPCIILKSDGTTIYATRDLAAAVYRKRHYDFYKSIYVVGTPQTLHFKQVFAVLEKMGFDWYRQCVHVGFGYVKFPDRNISTRSGDVVLLEDVLKEAVSKTKEIITQSETSKRVDDIDLVSEKIGVGAVLYAFLKNSRERDIIFTWEDMLDFEGESGPYVQYAYARGRSVLRKAAQEQIDWSEADLNQLTENEAYHLIKLLNGYTDAVRDAASKYEPSIVTRYVTDLAQQFNKFYNCCGIMKAEPAVRAARLQLTEAACICMKSALYLIGVEAVEKM